MATEFGLSSGEIIGLAEEMGIELDKATKDRLTTLDIDDVVAKAKIAEYAKALSNIPTSIQTMAEARANIVWSGASGGIVGYADGGIAGLASSIASRVQVPSFDAGGVLAMLTPARSSA